MKKQILTYYIDGTFGYREVEVDENNNYEEQKEYAPSIEDDLMSMAVDHEYRLTLLELGVI